MTYWFLSTKLVARKSQDLQAHSIVHVVELGKLGIICCGVVLVGERSGRVFKTEVWLVL
jgi:hypothetical protein